MSVEYTQEYLGEYLGEYPEGFQGEYIGEYPEEFQGEYPIQDQEPQKSANFQIIQIKDKNDKELFTSNVKYIILYALIFSIAFAINQASTSFFASLPNSQHFVSKVIYVVILIGITIFLAWTLKAKLNSIN